MIPNVWSYFSWKTLIPSFEHLPDWNLVLFTALSQYIMRVQCVFVRTYAVFVNFCRSRSKIVYCLGGSSRFILLSARGFLSVVCEQKMTNHFKMLSNVCSHKGSSSMVYLSFCFYWSCLIVI